MQQIDAFWYSGTVLITKAPLSTARWTLNALERTRCDKTKFEMQSPPRLSITRQYSEKFLFSSAVISISLPCNSKIGRKQLRRFQLICSIISRGSRALGPWLNQLLRFSSVRCRTTFACNTTLIGNYNDVSYDSYACIRLARIFSFLSCEESSFQQQNSSTSL